MDLDAVRNMRDSIVRTFDDAMDSKAEAYKSANGRFQATVKEAFTASDTSFSRAVRETTKLINQYDELYESNDTTYTNQRKMEFQLEEYERLRSWRMLLYAPYYIVFGLIVYYRANRTSSYAQIAFLVFYASLPFWVGSLVQFKMWLYKLSMRYI